MKNGYTFFAGIFASFLLSWVGIVWVSGHQLASLGQHFDANDELGYPQKEPGLSAQGRAVYGDLGCASCHTQQVRRPGYGFDKAHGWGQRQSVARDYIFQADPPLGRLRLGPDLANFGERASAKGIDRAKLLEVLYTGRGGMPAFRDLFETRKVIGRPLSSALPVVAPPGTQILPTPRAEALVSYLLGLKQEYTYPEAEPIESAPDTAK